MTGLSILLEETVPEKNLEKKTIYKYVPESSTLNHMLEDFCKTLGTTQLGDSIEFDIKIVVKKYKTNK